MGEVETIQPKISQLREALLGAPPIFSMLEALDFAPLLICLGLAQEMGTSNDELARFIFNAETEQLVPRESLRAEIIDWRGKPGVRLSSRASARLEIRIKGFRDLCHPDLGENADGTFSSVVIFPEIVAKIAAASGVELVIVRAWAMNSIFGGFGHAKGYYETNFWELENNDTLLFANLLSQRRLAFLGTHDLIAHVAGLNGDVWPALAARAVRVRQAILRYVGETPPSIPDLVLPYTAGVILDDLAQPPSYDSRSHDLMLDQVLHAMEASRVRVPDALLLTYPALFEDVITLSRSPALTRERAQGVVARFVDEIARHTARVS